MTCDETRAALGSAVSYGACLDEAAEHLEECRPCQQWLVDYTFKLCDALSHGNRVLAAQGRGMAARLAREIEKEKP